MDPKYFDDLAQGLMANLPKGLLSIQSDVEKNLRSALQAGFTRMNLVSREEFDVQAAVLLRTREKLERVERQVAELERQLLGK